VPRVAPLESPTGPLADEIRARRRGILAVLDRILLHSPPIAEGWNAFFGSIRDQASLDGALRELAILRVASLNGDWHNWNWHVQFGHEAGLDDTDIESVKTWRETDHFTEIRRAVLAYAEAMTVDIKVSDQIFADVRQHLDDQELVELTATIAGYNCVSRFLVAMQIDREL
jgi:alkylhydroperoxidase family enzyme